MSNIWPYLPARAVNIATLAEFDRLSAEALAEPGAKGRSWRVLRLDLSGRDAVLAALDLAEALFVDCTFSEHGGQLVAQAGGLCLATGTELPFDPRRTSLYTPAQLYAGIEVNPYELSLDAKIYAFSQSRALQGPDEDNALAITLHDHHMAQELQREVRSGTFAQQPVVGVMGGPAAVRGSSGYAQTLRLGAQLAEAGYAVATGGGPGAMEAANAGAWLAGRSQADLDAALGLLAKAPDALRHRTSWARAALRVKNLFPSNRASLGIPTWFYGHEPPNLFATHIAKFFTNSIREAILLEQSNGGVIVLPGAAGTVQEIFQDACENYYATGARVVPMVLVGREYWTRTLPAWPLLQALAAQRVMADRIALVDTVDEAVEFIRRQTPLRRRTQIFEDEETAF